MRARSISFAGGKRSPARGCQPSAATRSGPTGRPRRHPGYEPVVVFRHPERSYRSSPRTGRPPRPPTPAGKSHVPSTRLERRRRAPSGTGRSTADRVVRRLPLDPVGAKPSIWITPRPARRRRECPDRTRLPSSRWTRRPCAFPTAVAGIFPPGVDPRSRPQENLGRQRRVEPLEDLEAASSTAGWTWWRRGSPHRVGDDDLGQPLARQRADVPHQLVIRPELVPEPTIPGRSGRGRGAR